MDKERDEKFRLRLGRGPWTFEVLHGDRRNDDLTGAFNSDPLVRGQFQQDRYTIAQFAFEDWLSDTLSLSARAFARSYRYDSELQYSGAQFAFPAVGDWHGAELRLLSSALAGHTLMAGVEYHRSTRVRQHLDDLANSENDFSVDSAGSRIGLYAQDEWRPIDALAVTAGLRIDHNDTTGTELSPRLGLIWHAGPTTLKALYGRAHRAPNAYERDYDDGETQVGTGRWRASSSIPSNGSPIMKCRATSGSAPRPIGGS